MSTCKVEFKGFNIDSSSLDNYLNQFTIDGKQKIDGAKNTISYLLSNAKDNKLGVLKLALNSNKAYIKDLANMMLNTNRKFYAEVEINNNLKGFSKYNANDNKIYINVDAISQRFSESAEEYLYERIVHDFIQGFANRELKKAYEDANRDSPYMKNIINLFKEYSKSVDLKEYNVFKDSVNKEPLLDPRSERSLIREGYAEETYRAITNPAEFLSYGLSNSEFRNTLRKQNLWQKFVSLLKDLLGISQDNNDLEYLYKNLDSYLKQDDPYTLHSGGAIGADTVWGQIGKQFGISEENQRHYKTADMPNGNTQITEQDYREGRKEAAKAANRMFGYDKTEVNMGLLIRNWSQVKYSEAVYAVGRLVPAGENAFPDNKKEDTRIAKNPTVTGGTGYAVNMAILNNKPVYVYNQYDNPTYPKGWYKYDSNINDYVPTETPTLTRHFAGIGTRNINEDGEKAIQDTYEKTFNKKQQTGSQSSTDSNIKVEQQNRYSVQDVRNNPDKIFVFGDNSIRQGTGGQAQIRNEPNAVGIMTKKFPRNTPDAFLYDSEYAENIKRINEDIENLKQKVKGKTVVFPTDGIGTNLADIAHTAPRTMEYLINRLREEFGLKDSDPFIKSMLNKLNEARNGFGQKMLIDGEIYSYNVDKLKAYKHTFVGSGINAKQNATEVTDPNLIKKISDKYFETDNNNNNESNTSDKVDDILNEFEFLKTNDPEQSKEVEILEPFGVFPKNTGFLIVHTPSAKGNTVVRIKTKDGKYYQYEIVKVGAGESVSVFKFDKEGDRYVKKSLELNEKNSFIKSFVIKFVGISNEQANREDIKSIFTKALAFLTNKSKNKEGYRELLNNEFVKSDLLHIHNVNLQDTIAQINSLKADDKVEVDRINYLLDYLTNDLNNNDKIWYFGRYAENDLFGLLVNEEKLTKLSSEDALLKYEELKQLLSRKFKELVYDYNGDVKKWLFSLLDEKELDGDLLNKLRELRGDEETITPTQPTPPPAPKERYGEEFQVDQFVFSYNPETGKYYQHFKSKKGEVKELTNEKQQNKTFLKYIEKHPEHAEIVTYENTGNKYVYDKKRDKVISLSTADTIVQPDIVDKVKNHEKYAREEKIEGLKKYIKQYLKDFKDMSFARLYQLLINQGTITHEDAHDFSEAFNQAQQEINEEKNTRVYKLKSQLPSDVLEYLKNTISEYYDKNDSKDVNTIYRDFMKSREGKNGGFIFDVHGLGSFNIHNDIFTELFKEIKKEKELEKEAKKPPQYEHSFSYKGITIPTKFQLSEEQEQALITLIENITSGDTEPITLSGYAGTGKTSVIGYLEDYLKRKRGYKFLYGAPTHAATLYLGYNTKKMPFTIASSVVKRIDDFGNVTYTTSSKVDQALSDYDQNIFVVDEVSLMDSTTMDNFLSVMDRKGVKVIFMGDKMQLPEVASKGKINPETKNSIKDVSKAFTDFKLIQLSQVQRTKDNSILRVLTEIRNNPDGVLPVVDNTETLQFFNKDDNTKGFYKGFRTAYEADPEEAIYITYTNEDVKNFNKSFRKAFYGEDVDGLVEGESVIGYSGYNNKKIKSNDLANSIKYTVDDISYDGSEVKITLKSNAIQKLADLHSPNRENDKTVQTTYLQMSRTDSLDMKNLTDKDFLKNNSKLSEIFRDVYDLKKMALGTNRWKDFSETLAKITGGLAKLEIGDDYFYNPYTNMMEKESSVNWSNPQMANLKKNYKELFMSKSIDYGYGITIHKAQGATYKNVFFNSTSTEFAKTEIHENGMQISTEGNSLNYVAMSRASEKLFVLHSNNIKRLNNDDSIELSKNCSVF
jgi:hypothetical protein